MRLQELGDAHNATEKALRARIRAVEADARAVQQALQTAEQVRGAGQAQGATW